VDKTVTYAEYLSTIDEIIEDARNGRMFILVDDEGRENEGDLVIPAQMATPQAINFMAKHGRGLICLSMTAKRCEDLRLPMMTAHNETRIRRRLPSASKPRTASPPASRPPIARARLPWRSIRRARATTWRRPATCFR